MSPQQLLDRSRGLTHVAIDIKRSIEPGEWPLARPKASYKEAR